ncbi:hypothetical protein B0T24DRAFT_486480, partial [Lasiosphaeria ovina]
RTVNVLLLRWEYEDLGVGSEVEALAQVLDRDYGFQVQQCQIPVERPIRKLTQTISNWVDDHDSEHNLFILYYAGHGVIDEGRQVVWRNLRNVKHERFAELKWNGCEDILHEAVSDTLFLLDCCCAAGSASRPLKGFSETIAASGFESLAPPPGPHSFTNALTRVLRKWRRTQFSVVRLHNELLVALKEMPPEQISSDGSLFEWRRTPVHYIRSNDRCPPSVVVSSLATEGGEVVVIHEEPTVNSQPAVSPRVILSLILTEDLRLDDAVACRRWLSAFPLHTKTIHVEGVYHGLSTVVMISLPVPIWDHLENIPGCNFVCFTTSGNLLLKEPVPD